MTRILLVPESDRILSEILSCLLLELIQLPAGHLPACWMYCPPELEAAKTAAKAQDPGHIIIQICMRHFRYQGQDLVDLVYLKSGQNHQKNLTIFRHPECLLKLTTF